MLIVAKPAAFNGTTFTAELRAAGINVGDLDVVVSGNDVQVITVDESSRTTVEALLVAHTGEAPLDQRNAADIGDQLDLALDAMRAHVQRGTFTATQRDNALLLVLRVCIGLVRLTRRHLDAIE